MTANMYRVGDYVFFETNSPSPYQIRRIEELIKTPNGNVEAKVMCYYRRRDIPSNLIALADKHHAVMEEQDDKHGGGGISGGGSATGSGSDVISGGGGADQQQFSDKERHQLKHRELFLSRQVETLPATSIRGKCSVTLLDLDTDSMMAYLNREDSFYYSLVFDPAQKTLLADKGEIRVGSAYQADVPPWIPDAPPAPHPTRPLEVITYSPNHDLTDAQMDQFLVLCRSVGTFARALDCSSSVRQPSLHMSAAAASRDITLFHAMDLLHKHNYDVPAALSALVPPSGPVLCRDEMEEWSASEANLFEEALEKYGKDFTDIRADFLPWKTLKSIVEYYYMWKTTDRYVQQKRVKAAEAECKLKQVYIPHYNQQQKSDPNVLAARNSNKPCESCFATSSNLWYAWGPAHAHCRLCATCWNYWKKFGGLKYPTRMETLDMSTSSSSSAAAAAVAMVAGGNNGSPYISPAPGVAEPLIRCTICPKEFRQKAQLIKHYSVAHALHLTSPTGSVGGATGAMGGGAGMGATDLSSGEARPIVKTRAAFYLHTTVVTRQLRRLCATLLRPRHTARQPFAALNVTAIRAHMQQLQATKSPAALATMAAKGGKKRHRGKVVDVSYRLGTPKVEKPEWLKQTPPHLVPKPAREAFPRPPPSALKRPAPPPVPPQESGALSLALTGPTHGPKRLLMPGTGGTAAPGAPAGGPPAHIPGGRLVGRKHASNWVDAPDDVYYVATPQTKRRRRAKLSVPAMRRLARRPTKQLHPLAVAAAAAVAAAQAAMSTTTGVLPPALAVGIVPPSAH